MTRASLGAQTIQTNLAVVVQHAPILNGGSSIEGSLQQLDGETVTLNGCFLMTGDLLVPGTPTVVVSGHPTYAGTVPGDGSSSPSGYQVILNGNLSFNYLRTQTTPVTLPAVSSPPAPTGTQSVTITRPGQSLGSPETLRNLTLAGNTGLTVVPPGTYGNFAVSGGSGLVIGVAGAVQPATYNLQNLTLTGNATLKVVGPVILTVANGFTVNGCVGSSNNPSWLQLNIASGNFTLNGGSIVYGLVTAPNSEVIINGKSTLVGASVSANFNIAGNGHVRWGGTAPSLLPPVATNQTVTLAENSSTNIILTGFDPENQPLTYSVLTTPAHGLLTGTPPNLTYQPATNFSGDDLFTFDVNNGVTNSSPATISVTVTQVYYPPAVNSQTLTNLENTALPVTLTGSDPQGDPLTYSIVTQPANGTLNGTPPNLVYQPATNYYGDDAFTFQANDGVSNSAPATVSITVEAVDQAPIVSAGTNQLIVLPDSTANLNGTVSYSKFPNTVDTIIWSQVSGPGTVTFGNVSNTMTPVTFSSSGVYVLQLYASDSYLSASNTVQVTVDAPPVVNAGPDTTNSFPGSITLQGTAADDGAFNVLNVNWSEVSGPGTVVFSNPSATNSSATFSASGIYVLQLTADDGVATNYSDVTVIENMAPMVNAGANILTNGFNAMLNGSVSDDGLPGGYLAVQWVQSGGPGTATFSNPTSANTAVSVDQSGVYVFTLIATDGAATNSSEVDVTFNLPPVVTAGAQQTVNLGTVVTLAGVATDDQLPYNILDTVWSEVSGPGTATFAEPTMTNTTVTFDQPGVYDLRLTADDGFATNSADVTIQVHAAPVVSAGNNQAGAVGSPVTLAGSFVDDGLAGPVTSQWTQISGPVAATIADPTATNTTATISQDGVYVFALTVTDALTNSSAQVTIISVGPPSVTVADPSLLINWPANQVTLNGTATADGLPAGGTLTATWSQIGGPAAATLSNPVQSESLNESPLSLPSSSVATFSSSGVYVFQLAVTNQAGSAQSNVVVTVNRPPVVNAGVTQTNLYPAAAQLSGMVTDDGLPVGGQLTWSWSVVSGPGTVTFNNAALTNATATFSQSGLYVLQLTASDSAAVSSNQVVIIEDTAPTVQLATNQVPAGTNQVMLTGTVTDDGLPPGADLTATWGGVSGPGTVVFNPALETSPLSGVPVTNVFESTATFSVAGTYVVSLTADDSVAANSATISLSVASTPPVVSAGPDLYLSGVPATATLNGQVSDLVLPSGGTLTQQWSVVGGPGAVAFSSPSSPVTTATFSTNGIYVLQLTANNGQSQASSLVEVRVEMPCTVEDPEGLAAWWPANGNSEDVVNGLDAIMEGASYTNGEVSLAFNFDGTDDYVMVPGSTNYDMGLSPSGMTMEFWMKPNSFQSGSVLGWANSVRVERENMISVGAQLRCYLGSGGQYVQTPGPIWNNNNWSWTHVAVTYDAASGEADMYINGLIQASAEVGTNLMSTTNNFYMGQVPGSPNYYSGQLDEISLYRRPLNPEEVYNIYTSGSVGKCPDDTNAPPMVYAGPDLFLGGAPATGTLNGQVSDPALPPGGTLSQQWTVMNGPGTVSFSSPTLPVTTATFSTNGIYVLQLTANNGEAQASSFVEVRVETPCTVQGPDGLAAWWPANGTAEDVISGNYGILAGGISYTNGEVAQAFNFDGVDDFVDVPAATNYDIGSSPSGLTLEFWMKPNSFQSGSVLGWANSVRVERENLNAVGAQLRCYLGSGGQYVQTPGPVWSNNNWNWTHVAVTYDAASGEADMYINGSIAASANVGTNLLSTADDFYMGQVPGSPNFYSGQLDEISLYRRPLNPQEVYNIYASGSVGKCPDANTLAVYAGQNFAISSPTNTVLLTGSVTENGQAAGTNVQVLWTEYYGPGPVTFADPTSASSSVAFSANGIYILRLSANNQDEESSSLVEVRVGVPCDDLDLSGLSAWWPADGTAQDIIGGNEAILGGGTGYTNGEVATAFNFDGVDDFVLAPAATNYNVGASPAGMTIEFWMNPNSFQSGSVLGWANSVRVERENMISVGAQLRCYLGSGGQYVQTPGPVWNNANWYWVHVAVTYNATNGVADMYINGVLSASANVGMSLMSTTNDFYMGQVPGSPNFYSGQLDEISLYSQPLSAADIAAIYAAGSAGKCPP